MGLQGQAPVYIGTDGGATTSKFGGVWPSGEVVSTRLQQQPTAAEQGPEAMVRGWVAGVEAFLEAHGLAWAQVAGVGLAIPGPYQRYGVFGLVTNLPKSFAGFDVHAAYSRALAARAGREIPLVVGNDGNMGGIAEAREARGGGRGAVVMLAPGSGLGCAYIGETGLPLEGETLSGMEAGHMPAPLQELQVKPYPCGCGRTWGCVEVYTSLSGLPHLLAEHLDRHPEHPLARSPRPMKERAMELRALAQEGDALACEIFAFQARALGLHVASLSMALDPHSFVIGGGLMDPGATTAAFRERYLGIVGETAARYLWAVQRERLQIVPAVWGDLSQAIGAALAALYQIQT